MLTTLHGSWRRAAAIVLGEAVEGCRNEPRGPLSHQLPGAAFLKMSSGNYLRSTSADGPKFPKPRSPP